MKNTNHLQIKIELDDVEHLLEEQQPKQINTWETLTKEQQKQLDKIAFINY